MCVYAYMFVVCGGQRSTSGVIFKNSCFKTGSLNGLKLSKQARLAVSKQDPACLHLPNAGITSMCHGTGETVGALKARLITKMSECSVKRTRTLVHYWKYKMIQPSEDMSVPQKV